MSTVEPVPAQPMRLLRRSGARRAACPVPELHAAGEPSPDLATKWFVKTISPPIIGA
jgi:hypothetical protein